MTPRPVLCAVKAFPEPGHVSIAGRRTTPTPPRSLLRAVGEEES